MNETLEAWFAGWVLPFQSVRSQYGHLEPADMTLGQLREVADAMKKALDGLKEDYGAWRSEAKSASR